MVGRFLIAIPRQVCILLKNIEFESVLELPSLVEYQQGQVVSRTLVQNKAVSITLLHLMKMKK